MFLNIKRNVRITGGCRTIVLKYGGISLKKTKKSLKSLKSFKSLSYSKLRRTCDVKDLKFKSTAELVDLQGLVGQKRASSALVFGLEIKDCGFNIYALGPTGTGKTTAIIKYLEKEAKKRTVPSDWLYINNFLSNDKPTKLELPAGKGIELQEDMDKLVLELKTEVPKAFEGDNYEYERERIEKIFRTQSEDLLQKLTKKASENELQLMQSPQGFIVFPIVNGKALAPEDRAKLSDKELQAIAVREESIIDELHESMRQFEQMKKEAQGKLLELDQRVVSLAVNHFISTLREKYYNYEEVINFLTKVQEHLLKNVQTFKRIKQSGGAPLQENLLMLSGAEPTFDEYRVNLLVDNSKTVGAPVVFEKNPIGPNLVGRIEQQGLFGALVTNFRMIKGGALHRANGGYLILNMLDVLKKPLTWEILKRALKNREVVIENIAEALGAFVTKTLEPEPIPLDVKVVLIGDPMLYYLINEFDPEFRELFKVKADFASFMPWNRQAIDQYAAFIGMVCREEKLKHVDAAGVARIVEYGARITEHQEKITLRFGEIADIVRQAHYFADKNQRKLITDKDVEEAISAKIYRSNYLEEVIGELLTEKTLKISTKGMVVGQINGLSVLSLGDYSFGKPSRITARTYVGSSGVINIERETKLSGKIYNKGALVIAGYLGGKYARNTPFAFSASIAFEQVYETIDGDSASAAEIYVLLSSLSNCGLRQDLAVTGSVNQHGEIQAIGGVNEKIEGFYQVCKAFGLTGKQGVIIPADNVKNLMLRDEVLGAVKAGKFHVYAISNIDEGIELLMNKPAGILQADGLYTKGSISWLVMKNIAELAKLTKNFGDKKAKENEDK